MRVHLHAVCWNEVRMLPYFFRHYEGLVDRFFIYDDGSTDGSAELLEQHPAVELGVVPKRTGDSLIVSIQNFHNHCWKRSRGQADWVIVVAIDEHLYHESLQQYLEACRDTGVTAIPAVGFQMITKSFPTSDARLADVACHGMAWNRMNKLALFDPTAIRQTNFGRGRHFANPEGDVVYPPTDELRLLHYKYLGLDYLTLRRSELKTGLGVADLRNGWGGQWIRGGDESRRDYRRIRRRSNLVVDPTDMPTLPDSYRWWRDANATDFRGPKPNLWQRVAHRAAGLPRPRRRIPAV